MDLFEKLKAEPPVNKYVKELPPPFQPHASPAPASSVVSGDVKDGAGSPMTRESLSPLAAAAASLSPVRSRECSTPKDVLSSNERDSTPPRRERRSASMDVLGSNKRDSTPPSRDIQEPRSRKRNVASSDSDCIQHTAGDDKVPSAADEVPKQRSISNSSDTSKRHCKVRVKREHLDKLSAQANGNPKSKSSPRKGSKAERKASPKAAAKEQRSKQRLLSDKTSSKKSEDKAATLKKMTPTKAQQKLFEPVAREQLRQQSQQVRRCVVRVKRDNLEELQKKTMAAPVKRGRKRGRPAAEKKSEKRGTKRAGTPMPTTSPTKRGRPRKDASLNESSPSFFIKLPKSSSSSSTDVSKSSNESPKQRGAKSKSTPKRNSKPNTDKKGTKKLQSTKKEKSTLNKIEKKRNTRVSKAPQGQGKRYPKLTRTYLIKHFGSRWLNAYVRIERCQHPLMLSHDSKARARRKQTKKKSYDDKKQSVSFRDQVEVFGDSDDDDLDYSASTSKAALQKALVTPARLKKIENGKVVGEIELDASLFLDPKRFVGSTPLKSTLRGGRRGKKSLSQLKSETARTSRSERHRDAKIPLLNLVDDEDDDDDDDDDECEYIVPNEVPTRRPSNTNSIASANSNVVSLASPPKVSIVAKSPTSNTNEKNPDEVITSEESFVSAQDYNNAPRLLVHKQTSTEELSGGQAEVDGTDESAHGSEWNLGEQTNDADMAASERTMSPLQPLARPPLSYSPQSDRESNDETLAPIHDDAQHSGSNGLFQTESGGGDSESALAPKVEEECLMLRLSTDEPRSGNSELSDIVADKVNEQELPELVAN